MNNNARKAVLNEMYEKQASTAFVLFMECNGKKEQPIYRDNVHSANDLSIEYFLTMDGNNNNSVSVMYVEVSSTLSEEEALKKATSIKEADRIDGTAGIWCY